jgi:threonine/homoserine/homoserine lactone efflux protein
MFALFTQGILMGITLCLMVGPNFFQLIQISIDNSYRHALVYAYGVWVSDLVLILAAVLGVSYINILLQNHTIILCEGAIVAFLLIIFGLNSFFSKKIVENTVENITHESNAVLFSKGFIVNTFNPFNIIFWITLSSHFDYTQANSALKVVFYFSIVFLVTVLTDMGKAKLACRIKENLTSPNLLLVNKIIGILLIVSGLMLVFRIMNI